MFADVWLSIFYGIYLGLVSEPAIQYRKMTDYDYKEPYSNRDEYILLGDQSKFGQSVKYPLKYYHNYPVS